MNDQNETGWPDFPALMICLSIAYLINECPVRMSPAEGGGGDRFHWLKSMRGKNHLPSLLPPSFRSVSFSPFFHADNLIVSIREHETTTTTTREKRMESLDNNSLLRY